MDNAFIVPFPGPEQATRYEIGGKAPADKLTLGATGNVVVEMGMALYRLATLLTPSDFDDLDRLAKRTEHLMSPVGRPYLLGL